MEDRSLAYHAGGSNRFSKKCPLFSRALQIDRQTDGQIDGQTERRTDGRIDRHAEGKVILITIAKNYTATNT